MSRIANVNSDSDFVQDSSLYTSFDTELDESFPISIQDSFGYDTPGKNIFPDSGVYERHLHSRIHAYIGDP